MHPAGPLPAGLTPGSTRGSIRFARSLKKMDRRVQHGDDGGARVNMTGTCGSVRGSGNGAAISAAVTDRPN